MEEATEETDITITQVDLNEDDLERRDFHPLEDKVPPLF